VQSRQGGTLQAEGQFILKLDQQEKRAQDQQVPGLSH
jgi:hypothetical protein